MLSLVFENLNLAVGKYYQVILIGQKLMKNAKIQFVFCAFQEVLQAAG